MGDWSTWDEYVFTYTNQDDGVHIVHLACDTDVAEPEFLLPMAKAVVLIGEHAVRCPHRGRVALVTETMNLKGAWVHPEGESNS